MPSITVSARSGAPTETDADTRVIGLFEGETPDDDAARPLVESGEAKGGLRKLAVTHEDGGAARDRRGLGKRDEFDRSARGARRRRRRAGARPGRRRAVLGRARAGEGAAPIVEGTLLALYEFKQFKSKTGDDNNSTASRRRDRIARGRDRGRARGRRGRERARARRRRQRGARPAEHAVERRDAELPGRPRAGDRRRARVAVVRGARARRDRVARDGRVRVGRPRRARGAEADRAALRRRRRRPPPGLRRQGRDVRHRRDLDQARGQDARDEVRHVGRRGGHRVDGRDRAARAGGEDHRGRPVHREHAERPCRQAGRHRHGDERQDDRGQQHRRRGPADPGRRALLRGRRRAPSGSSTWPR